MPPDDSDFWISGSMCFMMMRHTSQGSHGLHWPLINSNHMMDVLGKRQMEEKKKEDAKRYLWINIIYWERISMSLLLLHVML